MTARSSSSVARATAGLAASSRASSAHRLVEQVLGQRQEDRAGPAAEGLADRLGHRAGDVVDRAGLGGPLGEAAEGRHLVDLLERLAATVRRARPGRRSRTSGSNPGGRCGSRWRGWPRRRPASRGTTAGRPVSCPWASAMNAAAPSWRVATTRMPAPSNASSRPRKDSPGTVKAYRTPAARRASATNRPTVRGPASTTGLDGRPGAARQARRLGRAPRRSRRPRRLGRGVVVLGARSPASPSTGSGASRDSGRRLRRFRGLAGRVDGVGGGLGQLGRPARSPVGCAGAIGVDLGGSARQRRGGVELGHGDSAPRSVGPRPGWAVSGSSRTGAGLQIELAQPGDDALEVVTALAGHADGVTLDLRLDLRELVPDQLGDLLGDLLGQAPSQADPLADLVAARLLHLAPVEDLERQAAPDGLRLDEVLDRGRPILVVGDRMISSLAWVRSTVTPLKSNRVPTSRRT